MLPHSALTVSAARAGVTEGLVRQRTEAACKRVIAVMLLHLVLHRAHNRGLAEQLRPATHDRDQA